MHNLSLFDTLDHTMQIYIITTFPEFFTGVFSSSMISRAVQKGLLQYQFVNPRDFATDPHRSTDDKPYGGGAGMVMKVEPIDKALSSIDAGASAASKVVALTSAKGVRFTQELAIEWSKLDVLVIICGHYQGVDERVAQHLADVEVRVGDSILTGGEPAAAIMIDAVTRLLPGVLGNESSLENETFDDTGLSGAPDYTRPEEYNGWRVPEVLLGGNHAAIQAWKKSSRKPIAE